MAIKVLSGERYNVLATGESVSVSPSANSLFPVARLYDGRPDMAFRFSATSTDATITVDGNRLSNGSADSWADGVPVGWSVPQGTIAESTVIARSGSAIRLEGGTIVQHDLTGRSGERVVFEAWGDAIGSASSGGGSHTTMYGILQNLVSGNYWDPSSSGWTSTPIAAVVFNPSTSGFQQIGPTAIPLESFAEVGQDRPIVRLSFYNPNAFTSAYGYIDDVALWSAVDFASIHGHNIRTDVAARLESSPDNFATSSSGSTVLQATMTKAQPAFYTSLSSAVDDRYWRLRLLYSPLSTDFGSAPTESVWIGEAVIGQATELTRPQDLGQEIRLAADNVRLSTPFGGTRVHRFGEQPRRILGMSFNYFTSSEYQEARQEVFERSFGSANPIVIVPDSDQPEVLHGRIDDTWAVRQTLETHFTENDLVVVEDAFPVWTP